MKPISIQKINLSQLAIIWDNGHKSICHLEKLRDLCPCASCSGETVLLHEYKPIPQKQDTPGRYELKGITTVGSYAIQLEWGDGHNTGIYSWEYLLKQCSEPHKPH